MHTLSTPCGGALDLGWRWRVPSPTRGAAAQKHRAGTRCCVGGARRARRRGGFAHARAAADPLFLFILEPAVVRHGRCEGRCAESCTCSSSSVLLHVGDLFCLVVSAGINKVRGARESRGWRRGFIARAT
eukprot:7280372-Prymnesium_polylepis.1